jgi:hypothetical protein
MICDQCRLKRHFCGLLFFAVKRRIEVDTIRGKVIGLHVPALITTNEN